MCRYLIGRRLENYGDNGGPKASAEMGTQTENDFNEGPLLLALGT